MKRLKKQTGLALLEVLVAALMMIVGSVAYMRLQQMGLKSSYNNYARTQGIVIAENFIDTLRNNIEYFQGSDINGHIKSSSVATKGVNPIDLSTKPCVITPSHSDHRTSSSISCDSEAIFNLQNGFIQQQLQSSVASSVLCYRVSKNGFVRVTYLWKDNSAAGKVISLDDLNKGDYCPTDFNAVIDSKLEQNMVSVYAQL